MQRTPRALTSMMTIFGLLVFVCLSWSNVDAANADSQLSRSKTHQIICTGPTATSGHVSNIKPRLAAFGSGLIAAIVYRITASRQQSQDVVAALYSDTPQTGSRPLWLINRALLI